MNLTETGESRINGYLFVLERSLHSCAFFAQDAFLSTERDQQGVEQVRISAQASRRLLAITPEINHALEVAREDTSRGTG